MKSNIFLTSQISDVSQDIPRFLDIEPFNSKLLFIDTAAEVEKGDLEWLKNDRNSLVKTGFNVSDFTITGKETLEIKEQLEEADIIFFSGGNQFHLLSQIQQTGCADIIRDLVKKGKIYIGSSAGSIVAGPDIYPTRLIDDANMKGNVKLYEGLGLVDFIVLPHWGSEDFREIYLNQRLENAYNDSEDNKLILLKDNQYIIVKDSWYKIISV